MWTCFSSSSHGLEYIYKPAVTPPVNRNLHLSHWADRPSCVKCFFITCAARHRHQVLLLPPLLPDADRLDGLQVGQEAQRSDLLREQQTTMWVQRRHWGRQPWCLLHRGGNYRSPEGPAELSDCFLSCDPTFLRLQEDECDVMMSVDLWPRPCLCSGQGVTVCDKLQCVCDRTTAECMSAAHFNHSLPSQRCRGPAPPCRRASRPPKPRASPESSEESEEPQGGGSDPETTAEPNTPPPAAQNRWEEELKADQIRTRAGSEL